MKAKYERVIIKLSGEALSDSKTGNIFDSNKLQKIVVLIKKLIDEKVSIGIVIGAGNIFRGRIASSINISTEDGDYLGMLGTIINCRALYSVLINNGIKVKLLSALKVDKVAPKYEKESAISFLNEGYVVLFAGGIGLPGYTTDTTASTRAIEVGADAILVGKNGVDGVYDKDPNKENNAIMYTSINYQEVLDLKLKVMDLSAIELLKNSSIVTRVFGMDDIDNFIKVVNGDDIGTTIKRR